MDQRIVRGAHVLGGMVIGAMLLVTVAACGQVVRASGAAAGATTGTSVRSIIEVDRYPANTPQRMCQATLVAIATVSAHGSAHWNTPTGQRPAGLTDPELQRQGYEIVTPVEFSTLTILLDHRGSGAGQPVVEYEELGGQAGIDSEVFNGTAHVRDGQRYVVVFAPALMAGGTSTLRSLTISDAFPIDGHGNVQLQPQAIEQGQVSQRAVSIALPDLTAQLSRCR